MKHRLQPQNGVALITVLLIIAISTTVATALSFQQRIDIRRTMNIMHWEQAYLYALSAEDLAKLLLLEDKKSDDDPKSPAPWDSLDEEWAKKREPFPTLNGYISGTIEDLQGRFNLNSLVDPNKNNAQGFNNDSRNKDAVDQFVNLIEVVLGEDQQNTRPPPEHLANAVVDWIDKNSDSTVPGGAEDLDYQSLEKPYRAANTFIASTSELLLIKGFDNDSYRKLEPFITALPVATKININTASAEVIASLDRNISEAQAQELTRIPAKKKAGEAAALGEQASTEEEKTAFENIQEFVNQTGITNARFQSRIDIKSNFFQLNAITMFGESQARVKSVFYRRDKDTIAVIMRGQGVL